MATAPFNFALPRLTQSQSQSPFEMSSARDLSTASVGTFHLKRPNLKPNPDTLECQLAIHPSEQFMEPLGADGTRRFGSFMFCLFIYW